MVIQTPHFMGYVCVYVYVLQVYILKINMEYILKWIWILKNKYGYTIYKI